MLGRYQNVLLISFCFVFAVNLFGPILSGIADRGPPMAIGNIRGSRAGAGADAGDAGTGVDAIIPGGKGMDGNSSVGAETPPALRVPPAEGGGGSGGTGQAGPNSTSCIVQAWEELEKDIRSGKRKKLTTDATILGTSIAVKSRYTPTASELDPSGIRASMGVAEDFSRPGAIVFLLSAPYMKIGKTSNKLFVGHALRNLGDLFYRKDLSRTKYDLLLFVLPDATQEMVDRVNASVAEHIPGQVRVVWHPIKAFPMPYPELREHFGQKAAYMTTCGRPKHQAWTENYLLMTVFRVLAKFHFPALRAYKYVWEVDADLVFDKVTCDVFGVMAQHKYVHAFYNDDFEPVDCPQDGFKEAMGAWAGDNGLCSSYLGAVEKNKVWNGAFQIFDMELFTGPAYLAAAEVYIKTGGLWKHRWTDQTWWPIVMSLLAPGRSHQFGGWAARHKGGPLWVHRNKLVDPQCS